MAVETSSTGPAGATSAAPPPAWGEISLWLSQAGDLTPRPSLPGDRDVDVAIVGAGFTGLWTAYYLAAADPSLRIAVIEKQIASYGASGRNGGWCLGHMNGSIETYGDREQALAMKRECLRTVDVIGAALDEESIDAGFVKGGALIVARTEQQRRSLIEGLAHDRELGFDESVVDWLDARALADRVRIADGLGAKLERQCARVQPARLARGLAEAAERRGVTIYEQTEVLSIDGRPRRDAVRHRRRGDGRARHRGLQLDDRRPGPPDSAAHLAGGRHRAAARVRVVRARLRRPRGTSPT